MTLKSLIPVKASNFSMFISVYVFTPPPVNIVVAASCEKPLRKIFKENNRKASHGNRNGAGLRKIGPCTIGLGVHKKASL